VTVEWETPYFLPFSVLNELRRRALDALTDVRVANRPMMQSTIHKSDVPYPASELSFHGNALNEKAVTFYRRHGVEEIEPAAESGLDLRGRVVMSTRYCLKEELGVCPRRDGDPQASQTFEEPLYLVDEEGHHYELRFHCGKAPDGCGMEILY
jgi:putative protease